MSFLLDYYVRIKEDFVIAVISTREFRDEEGKIFYREDIKTFYCCVYLLVRKYLNLFVYLNPKCIRTPHNKSIFMVEISNFNS